MKKTRKEELMTEKKDLESMMAHLEDEYRKANISEKSYSELKEKYAKKMEEIRKKLGESKEETLEESKEEKVEEVSKEDKKTKGTGRIGFLRNIFRRKEEKVEEETEGTVQASTETVQTQVPTETIQTQAQQKKVYTSTEIELGPSVEIEKLKVMVDTLREAKNVTDETIRSISESIGELRSMVLQADATLRESTIKMEKIEDDISEIKPQEIAKKFRDVSGTIERQQITLEKLERISTDLSEKINKVYEMLRGIGGIENLLHISMDVQQKLEDINEAVKYIERLGAKTEKIFIDLSKSLSEFVVYKARQEDLEESIKELIKSMDALNLKFEGYVSKKDLEEFKAEILVIKKQIEEINKVLPIAQTKLPESIISLRKEREDINLFLDSLEEQLREGKISREEYENIKNKNKKKLKEIEEELKREWRRIEKLITTSEKEKLEVQAEEKEEMEKPAEIKEEVKQVKEKKPREIKQKVERKTGKRKKR